MACYRLVAFLVDLRTQELIVDNSDFLQRHHPVAVVQGNNGRTAQ